MGISGSGSGRRGRRRNGWTSPAGLDLKFNDHNHEPGMNFPSPDDFHAGAWNVVNNPNAIVGDDIDGGGKIGIFDPKTGKLVIKNEKTNQKINFFVPNRGINYFNDNFNKR